MPKITVKDFCDKYIPQAGFVLIEKDRASEKSGNIWLTKSTMQHMARWAGSGRIKAMSPFHGENEHDRYLASIYAAGDHITFNATSPIDVPIPPNFQFEEADVALVLLHIADLLGWIAENAEESSRIKARAGRPPLNTSMPPLNTINHHADAMQAEFDFGKESNNGCKNNCNA